MTFRISYYTDGPNGGGLYLMHDPAVGRPLDQGDLVAFLGYSPTVKDVLDVMATLANNDLYHGGESFCEHLGTMPPQQLDDEHVCALPERDPRDGNQSIRHNCDCGRQWFYVKRMVGRRMYGEWRENTKVRAVK